MQFEPLPPLQFQHFILPPFHFTDLLAKSPARMKTLPNFYLHYQNQVPKLCDSLNELMLHSVNSLSKFETSDSPLMNGRNGEGSSFLRSKSQSMLKNQGWLLISGINFILTYGSFSNSFSINSRKCLLQFLL